MFLCKTKLFLKRALKYLLTVSKWGKKELRNKIGKYIIKKKRVTKKSYKNPNSEKNHGWRFCVLYTA